jgi:predicted ATPase
MITDLTLENFKAHRDTPLSFKQFTMLVGDNGSGKTSVLEAIRSPDRLRPGGVVPALVELVRWKAAQMSLSFKGSKADRRWRTAIAFKLRRDPERWDVDINGEEDEGGFHENRSIEYFINNETHSIQRFLSLRGRIGLFRFRHDQVAASAYSDQPDASVEEDGALTAVVLAALKLADDEAFGRIESAMRRIVPSVERVRIRSAKLKHPSNPSPVIGSKLYFDFRGAKDVPGHHASQGTLVVLALLTVLYSAHRPDVILLDDFDHSLHPRAQMELVRMIKELLALDDFKETQIIATTHSPYVLDELAPENVIAFALRDDGTVAAKPLAEHPDAATMKGTLKTGQLWSLDAERDWVLK